VHILIVEYLIRTDGADLGIASLAKHAGGVNNTISNISELGAYKQVLKKVDATVRTAASDRPWIISKRFLNGCLIPCHHCVFRSWSPFYWLLSLGEKAVTTY
jgi:hypothetical protein